MKWVALPQNGEAPRARSSHVLVAVGPKLYLFGGENVPRTPIDSQVHVYDLETNKWSQPKASGEAPAPRNAPSAAAIGERIFVFGGRTGIEMGEGSLGDLWAYDTASSAWSQVEPAGGLAPPPRSYHASCGLGNKLYVFGGCGTAGRLNDLWEFDTEASTWRELPASAAIKGRGGAGFAAAGGALWVIGGFTGKEMNDVHRFDPAAGRWDCGPHATVEEGAAGGCGCHANSAALPARSVFALAAHGCGGCGHGGHIVVFGGEVEPTDKGHAAAGDFSNDLFCFNTKEAALEGSWHKLEPVGEAPCPRGWLAAAATPAGIVIHGGNSNSNERLGDMFLLDMHA